MSYPVCPKCGHAPLPADQALPAACPACGLVLAKFSAGPVLALRAEDADALDDAPAGGFLARWLFHVPDRIASVYWYARTATLVMLTLWTVSILRGIDVRTGELGSGRTGAESDGHDWINIFGDFGLLLKARPIGLFFGLVGKAMMCAGLAWAAYMVWLQKAKLSDSPLAESDESRD